MLKRGTSLLNTVKDKKERIGRMLLMHSNSREDIKEAHAGDIVAIAGLKDTTTGDTLCDPMKPVILERIGVPEPVYRALPSSLKSKGDQEKLGVALQRPGGGGPLLPYVDRRGNRPARPIIAGHGRASQLDILVDRMRAGEFKVEANVGQPQVAYRRDHRSGPTRDRLHTHKKQTGGTGQFARVKILFESGRAGRGVFLRVQDLSAVRCPRKYIPGVEKGINSCARKRSSGWLPAHRLQSHAR